MESKQWQYKYNKIMETGFILDGNKTVVMTSKEYGEKIVAAMNAHDELVKALESILNQDRVNNNYADTCSKMRSTAANALDKLSESSPINQH